MHRLGRVPRAEAEAQYYSQHVTDQPAGSQNPEGAWDGSLRPHSLNTAAGACLEDATSGIVYKLLIADAPNLGSGDIGARAPAKRARSGRYRNENDFQ